MRILSLALWPIRKLFWLLGGLLRWAKRHDRSRSPYDTDLGPGPQVRLPDGSLVSADVIRWHAVSRHGLLQQGIDCPSCARKVAKAGDYSQVYQTKMGEALFCTDCKVGLLASPDDAVDPVTPKRKYDEAAYHTFKRPPGKSVSRPKQRTLPGVPKVGDWVVVIGDFLRVKGDPSSNLIGSEGRVLAGDGDAREVALGGNTGLGGTREVGGDVVEIPVTLLAIMALPSLRMADRVRVVKGPYLDQQGRVRSMHHGTIEVLLDGRDGSDVESVTIPIEHLEKIYV